MVWWVISILVVTCSLKLRSKIRDTVPTSVPGRILTAANAGRFAIVLYEPMLEEINTALRYPTAAGEIFRKQL